jgi:hypothetical protein
MPKLRVLPMRRIVVDDSINISDRREELIQLARKVSWTSSSPIEAHSQNRKTNPIILLEVASVAFEGRQDSLLTGPTTRQLPPQRDRS